MLTYRHSGSVPPVAALASAGCGLVAAVVGGVVYAYANHWIPSIYLCFLATAAFGALVGLCVGFAARAGHMRNHTVAGAVALVCMLVGLWVSWGASMWAQGAPDLGLAAFGPSQVFAFVQHLYVNGSWGLSDNTPVTGILLAVVWLVEAAVLVFLAVNCARAMIRQPYCEGCRSWTESEQGVAHFDAGPNDPVWSRVLSGDFPALGEIPLLTTSRAQYVRVDFAKCPKCDQSNFVTLQGVTITVNQKGETHTAESPLIVNGVLTPGQAEIVRQLGAMAEEAIAVEDARIDAEEARLEAAEESADQPTNQPPPEKFI